MISDNETVRAITEFIFIEHRPEKSDAIFLPGGSNPYLPEKGARLWKEGYAPVLVASGNISVKRIAFPGALYKADEYPGPYESECAFYRDVLLRNGVPDPAILLEERAGYTKQNALFSRARTDEAGISIKQGIIVCKAFHARRCLMYYQIAYPDARLLVCPVPMPGVSREDWYQNEKGASIVLGELARCGAQFGYDDIRALTEIKSFQKP